MADRSPRRFRFDYYWDQLTPIAGMTLFIGCGLMLVLVGAYLVPPHIDIVDFARRHPIGMLVWATTATIGVVIHMRAEAEWMWSRTGERERARFSRDKDEENA